MEQRETYDDSRTRCLLIGAPRMGDDEGTKARTKEREKAFDAEVGGRIT